MSHHVTPDGFHVRQGERYLSPSPVVAQRPRYSTKQARTGGSVFYLPRADAGVCPPATLERLADYVARHNGPPAPPEPKRVVFRDAEDVFHETARKHTLFAGRAVHPDLAAAHVALAGALKRSKDLGNAALADRGGK